MDTITLLEAAALDSVLGNSGLAEQTLYWLAAREIEALREEVRILELKAKKRK